MIGSVQVDAAGEREAELAEQQRKIVNRLRRAQGQLAAVVKAVDAGAECRDVVIQLAAVSKALDRAGYAIVASAMRNCRSEERRVGKECVSKCRCRLSPCL